MSNSQIEALVANCIENIKKTNQNVINEQLAKINTKDINEVIAASMGLVLDTMYTTVSQAIIDVLCEYDKN